MIDYTKEELVELLKKNPEKFNEWKVEQEEIDLSEVDFSGINLAEIDFTDVDLKAGLKEKDFELSEFIEEKPCEDDNCNEKKSMNTIETAIYPLYMPANTYLNSSEMVNSELDSRIILTFSGDKNFVLVEESSKINNELEIIPVYGEPIMLNDTIGAISNNSMYWTSNDVDYYLVSNDLTESEMAMVATSLSNAKSTLAEK